MNKANECTCPSGDGSLRWPCPAHPAVDQADVAAKLTFINGRPAMCGCQVEYSDGGGEYSDVIYVTLCAKHSGSAILDLVATNRIALTPEYEGQWHADLYLDREIPLAKVEGATPAEAVLALMSAERIDPEQESVEQAGGDERAAFEAWMTWLMDHVYGRLPDFTLDDGSGAHYVNAGVSYAWTAWQARAALAQPSPAPVCTTPTGENCPGDGVKSCKKCPEQAEAERPEVVAFRYHCTNAEGEPLPGWFYSDDAGTLGLREPLMTVAQHERIVGTLDQLREALEWRKENQAGQRELLRSVTAERDAALAKVAELDQALAEKDPFGAKLNRISEKLERCDALLAARAAQAGQVPQAWLDVQAERRRQIEAEGWTPEHDDEHSHGQMARAAACYALAGSSAPNDGTAALLVSLAWPWDQQWWKPTSARRDLVKACALVLAEIERLDRACISQSPQPGATTASS